MDIDQVAADVQDVTKYALHLKSVQGSCIKSLFEVLKELLTDVNIIATDKGLKIIAMDSSHVTLCHCFLDSAKFEVYHCPNNLDNRKVRSTIDINLVNIH